MSEQTPQNQYPLNPEDRDQAIFDTVAEFRNELDNPVVQQKAQVPEYSNIADHDAENKPVDVDAIFDNRKAEIAQPGSGRHRKGYSEEADLAAQGAGMKYRAKRVAQQMAEGVALQGFAKHRRPEEFVVKAEASADDLAKRTSRNNGANTSSEPDTDKPDFDPAAAAEALRALGKSRARVATSGHPAVANPQSLQEAEAAARLNPSQGLTGVAPEGLPPLSGVPEASLGGELTGGRITTDSGYTTKSANTSPASPDQPVAPATTRPAPAPRAPRAAGHAPSAVGGSRFARNAARMTQQTTGNVTPEAPAAAAETRGRYAVEGGQVNVPAASRQRPEYAAHGRESADAVIVDTKNMLVATLDGMGGRGSKENGLDRLASEEVSKLIADRYAADPEFSDIDEAVGYMKGTLLAGHRAMEAYSDERGAVGAVVKGHEINGQLYAVVGIVGDCVVSIKRPGQKAQLVGFEQSDPNEPGVVFNAMGGHEYDETKIRQFFRERYPYDDDNYLTMVESYTDQVEAIPIEPGTIIATYSDGVAGDLPEDRLKMSELRTAMSQSTPQQVADTLLAISQDRKNDDKGAAVLFIGNKLSAKKTPVVYGNPERQRAALDAWLSSRGGESTTVVPETPEATRRQRVIARLGKLVNTEQIRSGLQDARNEVTDAVQDYRAARRARRALRRADRPAIIPEPDASARESLLAKHSNKIAVAAAGIGVAAVAAGLGIQHNAANAENTPEAKQPSASAEATTGQYGPQAPKASKIAKASATTSAKSEVSPTAIPDIPYTVFDKPIVTASESPTKAPSVPSETVVPWANKPPVPEPGTAPAASAEKQQTRNLDRESISFTTTKDGKVMHATATLKRGGSIDEAARAAGLTATEAANAVNKAGITEQQAEHLPVGQKMNFDRQSDGSYVVHLQQ